MGPNRGQQQQRMREQQQRQQQQRQEQQKKKQKSGISKTPQKSNSTKTGKVSPVQKQEYDESKEVKSGFSKAVSSLFTMLFFVILAIWILGGLLTGC